MRRSVYFTILIGIIITAVHSGINQFILDADYRLDYSFVYDLSLVFLSTMMILITAFVSEKDHNKTALTYAYLSVVKLLVIAIALLIVSGQIPNNEKMTFAIHIISTAFLLIIVETFMVKSLIKNIS